MAVKPTNNPEAYDAYLRGLAFEARSRFSLVSIDLVWKAVGFYERAVQLDPNFALACGAAFPRRRPLSLMGRTLHPPLDATRQNVLWRMHRTSSMSGLRPCSPWVTINTGCCVITVLPKPRSIALANSYPVVARYQRRSAMSPNARETGIKALPISSKPSRSIHVMLSYSSTRRPLTAFRRQFSAALKLYDRVLDITPNDPDVMAAKAGVYQTQGNLQEAAKFLSEINWQTPSRIPSQSKSVS